MHDIEAKPQRDFAIAIYFPLPDATTWASWYQKDEISFRWWFNSFIVFQWIHFWFRFFRSFYRAAKMSVEPKRKLVILNLDEEETNDTVLNMCKMFGNVIHFNRPPLSKNYAFVTYEDVRCVETLILQSIRFWIKIYSIPEKWLQFRSRSVDRIEEEKSECEVCAGRIDVAQHIGTDSIVRFKWKYYEEDDCPRWVRIWCLFHWYFLRNLFV